MKSKEINPDKKQLVAFFILGELTEFNTFSNRMFLSFSTRLNVQYATARINYRSLLMAILP